MNEFSRSLYFKSLIQPHLDYCSLLFHMMDKGWMKKFETIQRKFIKAVKLNKDILNYDDVFKEMKITRVDIRFNVNLLKMFNRIRVNEKPFDLYEKIRINNDVRLRELTRLNRNFFRRLNYENLIDNAKKRCLLKKSRQNIKYS